MKRILESIIFIICIIGLPVITSIIVEIISNIISMNFIINIIGLLTIMSIVYIINNI